MTHGFGANSLMAKSCEPIRADGESNRRSCWPVHRSRAHWKALQMSITGPARMSGTRDIQETLIWHRPSSYQQSQSYYPRSWRVTPQAYLTSNAPGLARRSAARWVRSSKTANVSRGPRLAASVVHCQTTSASNSAECTAPLTGGNHDSQALRLLGRGSRAVFWRLDDIRGPAPAKSQDKDEARGTA